MNKSLSFLFLILLTSCAKKEIQAPEFLAANRKMGITLKWVRANQQEQIPQFQKYFEAVSANGLGSVYGSKGVVLPLKISSTLETPENIYEIGRSEVDDLFVLEAAVYGNFDPAKADSIPQPEDESNEEDAAPSTPVMENHFVEFSGTIFNGSNLRAVNNLKFNVPSTGEGTFQQRFNEALRKATIEAFPNPNLYPRSNPEHFANLLYVLSKKREEEVGENLSCENANQVIGLYVQADELYRIAIGRGINRVVGQQQDNFQMMSRQEESVQKKKILEECLSDAQKTFAVNFDFQGMDPQNQEPIRKAFEIAKLEELLKKYTDKPANFKFQVEANGELSLFVDLRFNKRQYAAWTLGRIPDRKMNFTILSLDPYYALMQKLVVFKASLPQEASSALRVAFEKMPITLTLSTPISGSVSFGVGGTYLKDRNPPSIRMAYPNSVILSAPGFENKTIQTKSIEIFQEHGWIALGNCKTLDGTLTEDGLVYKFFGLPCQ